jgi:hypothetical protein
MKKFFFLILLSISLSQFVLAQAYEGSTKYDKKTQRAILIDYPYPPEAVENAFVEKMAKLGYKPKEEKGLLNRDKGFLVFKNAYVTEISDQRMDYIINVERKSRKESDASVLYVIISRDGDNALDRMESESIGRAKSFLNNMMPDVEAANLELMIKDQEDKISKAEKKLRDLRDDQSSLEKKLQDNKRDQDNTQKDIEVQKQNLGTLIGKRRNN